MLGRCLEIRVVDMVCLSRWALGVEGEWWDETEQRSGRNSTGCRQYLEDSEEPVRKGWWVLICPTSIALTVVWGLGRRENWLSNTGKKSSGLRELWLVLASGLEIGTAGDSTRHGQGQAL